MKRSMCLLVLLDSILSIDLQLNYISQPALLLDEVMKSCDQSQPMGMSVMVLSGGASISLTSFLREEHGCGGEPWDEGRTTQI